MLGSRIDALAGLGGFDQRIHVNIHVIENARPLLIRGRPQNAAQILDQATAEPNRRRQEQRFQAGAIETLTDELAGGDQYAHLPGLKAFRRFLALPAGQIAGKDLGGHLITDT